MAINSLDHIKLKGPFRDTLNGPDNGKPRLRTAALLYKINAIDMLHMADTKRIMSKVTGEFAAKVSNVCESCPHILLDSNYSVHDDAKVFSLCCTQPSKPCPDERVSPTPTWTGSRPWGSPTELSDPDVWEKEYSLMHPKGITSDMTLRGKPVFAALRPNPDEPQTVNGDIW